MTPSTQPPATTDADPARHDPPPGFREAVNLGGPFVRHNGPLFARWTGSRVQLGFRVLPQHTNPMGIAHGGMMATLADMLLPCAVIYQHPGPRHFLPTISLQVDYLGPSPAGAWVQGEGEVLRATRKMVFVQGLVTADGEPVLRASGVFKFGPALADALDHDPFGLLKT